MDCNTENNEINTITQNNDANIQTLLTHYDSFKQKILNVKSKFLSDENYVVYFKTSILTIITIFFALRILTTNMLLYIYFFNNLINTIKFKTNSDNSKINNLIDNWIGFGSILILTCFLNFVSYFLNNIFVTFLCELLKCFTYYKMFSDNLISTTIINKITLIYTNNKAGIDSIQLTVKNLIENLLNVFNDSNVNKFMMLIKKYKNN